jgi:hypothetical protein
MSRDHYIGAWARVHGSRDSPGASTTVPLRESRDPAAILPPRVLADVVAVQVRAHHEIDVLDPEPNSL